MLEGSSSCPSDDADERPIRNSSPQPHCSYKPKQKSLRSYSSKNKNKKALIQCKLDSNLNIMINKKLKLSHTKDHALKKLQSAFQSNYDLRSKKSQSSETLWTDSDTEYEYDTDEGLMTTDRMNTDYDDNTDKELYERSLFRLPTTPLEVPYLLNKIFEYLPLEDWKQCRLVNKQWQSATVPQLRNFRLNIKDHSRLLSLVTYKDQWAYNTDRETYANVELPSTISLRSYHLNLFFDAYGRHIKSLIIPNNGWSVEDLQVVLFSKCRNLEELKLIGDVPTDSEKRLLDGLDGATKLPQLKRLFLHFTNAQEKAQPMVHLQGFYNSGTNMWTKRLIADLLYVSSNLEVVRCSNKRDMVSNPTLCNRIAKQVNKSADDIEASFSRVNQFLAQKLFSRSHDSTPKLVDLDLYLRLNDRGMEKLEMKKYPLQALDLHVRFFDKMSLVSLLQSLGSTLKHLRLRVDRLLMIDFPCTFFTELESLHLEDYAGILLCIGDMPKLKTLILDRFDCKRFTKKENLPCFLNSKVNNLSLISLRPPEKQGKCIKRIATLLPNIRDFTLSPAKDADLLRVFDSMPLLEHLKLVSEAISSSGLSGFTEADIELILDSGYELNRFNEYEGLRRLPYIGDLKNLKTLILHGDLKQLTPTCMNGRMLSNMHGLWIFHGICNLKHLRRLSVHNTNLSSLELKQIVKRTNIIRLEMENCKIDAPMERWIRRKTFGKPFQFVYLKNNSIQPV